MKTIELIARATYGVMRCALCTRLKEYHAEDKRTQRPKAVRMRTLIIWAIQDGWRKGKRGKWHCPSCAAREGLS